jgi:adenylate cyclase
MVSGIVHDQVRDKLSFDFDDMGQQTVKNITRPVGVHRVQLAEHSPRRQSSATVGKLDSAVSDRRATVRQHEWGPGAGIFR